MIIYWWKRTAYAQRVYCRPGFDGHWTNMTAGLAEGVLDPWHEMGRRVVPMVQKLLPVDYLFSKLSAQMVPGYLREGRGFVMMATAEQRPSNSSATSYGGRGWRKHLNSGSITVWRACGQGFIHPASYRAAHYTQYTVCNSLELMR